MKVLRFGRAPERYIKDFFDKLISELERPNVQQQKPVLDAMGSVRTVTDLTTLAASDYSLLVDTSAGNVAVTLPPAPFQGQTFVIKKITTDSNTLTVARNGKNINGTAANLTTAATDLPTFRLQYNGTNGWWEI